VQDVSAAIARWKITTPGYRMFADYYAGRHQIKFATQNWQEKYGPIVLGLRENLCPAVVSAFTDKMEVESWGVDTLDETAEAGLARLHARINRESFRTGDAYVLVWPGPDGAPRPHYHRADQFVHHVSPTDPAVLDWAAKVWQDGDWGRVNVYYEDRVERFRTVQPVGSKGEPAKIADWPEQADKWAEYNGDGDQDTDPAVITHQFGVVPVCWFPHDPEDDRGRSILTDVIPLQDALNKSVADLVVTGETYARPFWYLLGYKPELKLDPATGKLAAPPKFDPTRQQIFTSDAPGPMGQLDPPDLTRLLAVQDGYALKIARVVGMPAYYLTQTSGDVPSGESLRTLTSRLTAAVRAHERETTPVWRGLLQLLGIDGWPRWADPTPIDAGERLDQAVIKRRDLGLALVDVLEQMGETDAQQLADNAAAAAEQAATITARQWAQGNLLGG